MLPGARVGGQTVPLIRELVRMGVTWQTSVNPLERQGSRSRNCAS
jgi:hypothetical protein